MLEPHTRTLLFDVLRPPDHHSLDFAIATTYTLDLLALLTAPVAFSLFEADDHRELLKLNSLTLLESLRRYADRLTVFTQAGQIGLPKAQFPQFEFLEHVVVECRARVPRARFHPKVWVMRFLGPADSVRYRFACLSRNLTFDRCWDTVLTLEGALTDRRNAIAANHPLADFIAALPDLCVRPIKGSVHERVTRLASELRRVAFELPDGFESYRFHPLGLEGKRGLPFDHVPGRILAVSPFVSDEGLKRIFRGRKGSLLVSREESMADGCRAPEIERYYVMRDVVQTEQSSETEQESPTARGLHAKCYIAEEGWKVHIWTGSANATTAGFNGNVEFLVELVGSRTKLGIDSLFENVNGKTSFGDMLEEFRESEVPATVDAEARAFSGAVDEVRAALLGNTHATVVADGAGYVLNVTTSPAGALPMGVSVVCWPVTLGAGYGRSLPAVATTHAFSVAFESITSFVAFRVLQESADGGFEDTFVLNVPLTGAPADRRDRLLRAVIQNRDRFVRYLLLLLADEGFELAEQMAMADRGPGEDVNRSHPDDGGGLLESLLRTLDRDPARLAHIARLVEDLRQQPDATQLLPERFDEVWAQIWSARQSGRRA